MRLKANFLQLHLRDSAKIGINMCIVNRIKNVKNFQVNIKKFKIIIGFDGYANSNNKKQQSQQLILSNFRETLYNNTSGKVAFIPAKHTYPCSFILVMGLIFGDIGIGNKIITKLDKLDISMECLVKYLYNKGYLFVNSTDINNNNFDSIFSKAESILVLGKSNSFKKIFNSKLKELKIKTAVVIHPSSQNFDKESYHKVWFEYDSSNIIEIEGCPKLKLSDLKIK